jgi:hypothetical protein
MVEVFPNTTSIVIVNPAVIAFTDRAIAFFPQEIAFFQSGITRRRWR